MAQKQKPKTENPLDPAGYLAKPYGRLVVPEQDGSFRAEILEFPGCIALDDTAAKALAMLEDVAWSWLEAALDKGRAIPEPLENVEFSGKFVLRLPKSMHKKASRAAERDGVSLNQFIVSSLAEYVGARSVTNVAQPKAHIVSMHAYPVASTELSQHFEIGMTVGAQIFHGEYEDEVVATSRRTYA